MQVLLLDEPTNHLDLESIDALVSAIRSFEGGCVLISHDRRLLQATDCALWLCEGGEGGKGVVPLGTAYTFEHYEARVLQQVRVWHARTCPPCMYTPAYTFEHYEARVLQQVAQRQRAEAHACIRMCIRLTRACALHVCTQVAARQKAEEARARARAEQRRKRKEQAAKKAARPPKPGMPPLPKG